MTELAFWILALIMVGAALAVVLLRDITVAGIYITLNADFLAAVQVLIYAGAIGILLIFAIMLTRNVKEGNPFGKLKIRAFLVSLLVFATIVGVVVSTNWATVTGVSQAVEVPVGQPTTGYIAIALFDQSKGFVLPFEFRCISALSTI